MWSKPAQPSTPTQTTPQSPQASQQTAPHPVSSRSSVFGKETRIIGEIDSGEELFIDGELEGRLTMSGRLTIGPSGKVKANIKATEVDIQGSIRGNVEAENKISMRNGASVVGDVRTAGINIEDGAYFKGGIDISRPTEKPQKDTPTPATPNASAARSGQRG